MKEKPVKVEVVINLTEEQQNLIPRPGEVIHVVRPYNVDDDFESSPRPKEKPTVAYSYDDVPVKSSVLSDELDEVRVNGDFTIPLVNRSVKNEKAKIMVFTSETEAKRAYRDLMNVSIELAKERLEYEKQMLEYLEGALEENAH
jgi:hypothetical protein